MLPHSTEYSLDLPPESANIEDPHRSGVSFSCSSDHKDAAISNASSDFMQLCEVFPNTPEECLRFVFELSSQNLSVSTDCMITPAYDNLLQLIHDKVIAEPTQQYTIRVDQGESSDDLFKCVCAYYKGSRFNPSCEIQVSLRGQPAVDTGGVRRQVFSDIFKSAAFSDELCLFEGPPLRRRPTFRISNLTSGMMKLVGRIIGHSIILDHQGFPYLSPVCFSYMVGDYDQALLVCTPEDASERVQMVVKKVGPIYDKYTNSGKWC